MIGFSNGILIAISTFPKEIGQVGQVCATALLNFGAKEGCIA